MHFTYSCININHLKIILNLKNIEFYIYNKTSCSIQISFSIEFIDLLRSRKFNDTDHGSRKRSPGGCHDPNSTPCLLMSFIEKIPGGRGCECEQRRNWSEWWNCRLFDCFEPHDRTWVNVWDIGRVIGPGK